MALDLTAFTEFTTMRRADIAKFVGNDPRSVRAIEELQNLLSGNVPDAFSSILGTSIIAGDGLTDGGTLSADVTLNVGAGTGLTVSADAIGIANTTVTAGSYGDATHVAQVTFNAQGQATAASSVALHLPNSVTFQATGGAAPGTAFDGSGAVIVDYHTIGAQAAGSYLTGNQTITVSGDATGSGTTSIPVTIANGAVTYAKIQNVSATSRLLGRVSSGAGVVEEVVLDTDSAFTANSDSRVPTQKAVKSAIAASAGPGTNGAAWILITTRNCATSPAANQDFTGLAAYNELLIIISGVTASGATAGRIVRLSVDNGVSFYAGSTDYQNVGASGAVTNQGSAAFTSNTGSTAALSAQIQVRNTKGPVKLSLSQNGTTFFSASASDVNAVRVTSGSTDTLNGGTIYLYGR